MGAVTTNRMVWRSRKGAYASRGGTAYLGVAKDIRGGSLQTEPTPIRKAGSMQLVDPFNGRVVAIGKADNGYIHASMAKPLLPTGKHVSHANDLKVVRRGGRKSTQSRLLVVHKK